jgi:uncharacterized 2Fe-2S/4Fe-4S cluster protein (DUF4445 family)
MPKVIFITSVRGTEKRITCHIGHGANILEAARRAGIKIETPCGGIGVCGKCGVGIEGTGDFVPACRTAVENNAVYIVKNYEEENNSLRILSGGIGFTHGLNPFISKKYASKKYATGKTEVYGGGVLLGVEEGDTTASLYGLAVDIGTTTIVVSLADLQTGKTPASESALNPQSLYAQDVLGRIHFAGKGRGLNVLYNAFIEALNGMIETLAGKTGINTLNIYEVVYSGNTTMLHLACNVDPSSMGRYPYAYQLTGGCHREDRRLSASPFARIYLPPVISAYVGADITSGILITRIAYKKGVTLFIDIGTNGEMVLARDGRMAASSTAAGPAFEGMNISCGMRASTGAIESFTVEDSGSFSYKTIGGAKATGICGSGLLDIAGELVRSGVIDKNGRLVPPETGTYSPTLKERIQRIEGKYAFLITGGVYLSQKDVRQIQLAKGAIRCGIEMLLSRFGVTAEAVDEVIISGSFGYHLNERSLINIGLLPSQFAGKISFAGNTSLSGAAAFLLNVSFRDEIKELAARVDRVELAQDAEFERTFIQYMGF